MSDVNHPRTGEEGEVEEDMETEKGGKGAERGLMGDGRVKGGVRYTLFSK